MIMGRNAKPHPRTADRGDIRAVQILLAQMHEITAQSNYSPFVFKDNYRKAENSTPTNLIIYDIDEGLTLDKAVTLCADFKSLIVTTKSHQVEKNGVVCDRFRVIIPLDEAPPKAIYKKFYTTLAEMLGIVVKTEELGHP